MSFFYAPDLGFSGPFCGLSYSCKPEIDIGSGRNGLQRIIEIDVINRKCNAMLNDKDVAVKSGFIYTYSALGFIFSLLNRYGRRPAYLFIIYISV